jgi:predicted MPP superfamily phosphohydrolase
MGAATALLYGKAEFIVADSSFKSFKSLCKQVAKSHSPGIPNFMVNCIFPCVFSKLRWDVDKKAQYDVDELDILTAVKNLNDDTVVIFISGNHDILVDKRNS